MRTGTIFIFIMNYIQANALVTPASIFLVVILISYYLFSNLIEIFTFLSHIFGPYFLKNNKIYLYAKIISIE